MPAPITCPSGFSGVVRGLTAREIEVLADKDLFKSGEYMDEFLKRCWVSTSDKWVYTITGDKPDWGAVLACDRFYSYVQIGRATWGDLYPLKIQCVANACRESFEINVPLPKLSVMELPEQSRTEFANGNKLEAWFGRVLEPLPDGVEEEGPADARKVIDAGKRVVWSLPTGKIQWQQTKRLRERKKLNPKGKQNPLLDALEMRIVEVDGVELKKVRGFLADQELRLVRDLFNQMDDADGGIETETEVSCPHCETRWTFHLPFGPEFIFPNRSSQKTSL